MVIDECRICDNRELLPVLDLGPQALTGVFPRSADTEVPAVPLELVKCSPAGCGLVQLRHTADFDLMYNENYGYRSGIREFMINHLHGKVRRIVEMAGIKAGDLVVDIGSNDATTLRGYPEGPQLVGFDPVGGKFADQYPPNAELVTDYFSAKAFTDRFGSRRAKAVTSIAMFYDLPRPMEFMQQVRDILADDGVWILEQSYMPAMLDVTAYDVICHEHLEYYALQQIEWMASRVGLTVVRAEITDVYGGSLEVVLTPSPSKYKVDELGLARIRSHEKRLRLDTMAPFEAFGQRAYARRDELVDFLAQSAKAGLTTFGYGASTKGNVVLQFCGLGPADLPFIGEVSPEKAGCYTPGTGIPIISEEDAKAKHPDQLLVLPWIYRDGFVEREKEYVANGGRLVFPLPELDIVK